MIFENKGQENTDKVIELAYEKAKKLGIDTIVVATTTGNTARKAQAICKDMKVVAVSYHAGFKEPFKLTLSDDEIKELENAGIKVVCATHALSGVERGLSKKLPGMYPVLLVAQTLKLFGQGTKVALEVSVMAADSGALDGSKIIAVGGSSKGADTALVVTPQNQSNFFDIKINEIICKPGLY